MNQTANRGYNGNDHPNAIEMKCLTDDIKTEWFTWTKPALYSPSQCLSAIRLHLSSVLQRQKEREETAEEKGLVCFGQRDGLAARMHARAGFLAPTSDA